MTSMPDLRPTGWGASMPLSSTPPPRPPRTEPEPAALLEPQVQTSSRRAETRRIEADRSELQTQQRTAEGVKEALSDTRREVAPRLIDVRRLSTEASSAEAARRDAEIAQQRLDATNALASSTRAAAARLAAQRIALQTQAGRVADEVAADARALADINAEVAASTAPSPARTTQLQADQRQVVDRLVEATGATAVENADGTVDLRLADRALVQGDTVEDLELSRPALPQPVPTTEAPVTEPTAEGRPMPTKDAPVDRPTTPTSPPAAPADEPTTGRMPIAAEEMATRWSDGEPAMVGGRLGGLVAADRTIVGPAIVGLDQVAASIAETVNGLQAASPGGPGLPLLEGESALTLRTVPGVAAAEVLTAPGHVPTGTPLPGTPTPVGTVPAPAAGAVPAPGQAVPTPATGGIAGLGGPLPTGVTAPEDLLAALEGQAGVTVGTLGRKAELLSAFAASSGAASARLGQHLSAALGAIGDVAGSDVVTALTQANSAMTFAGAAARRAVTDGIPVLVGSSDPAVATAAGVLPLDAEAPGLLQVQVLAVAPAGGAAATVPPGGAGAMAPGAAASTPGVTPVVTPTGDVVTDPVGGVPTGIGAAPTATGEATVPDGVAPGPAVPGQATPAGVPPVPSGEVAGVVAADASALDPAPTGRTRAVVDGVELTSATRVLADLRPGVDVTVHKPGQVTLAVTPDPGPALGRVQGLVDAVGRVSATVDPDGTSQAIALPSSVPPAGGPSAADAAAGPAKALTSVWSTLSTFASSFSPSSAPAASAPVSGVSTVLGAVATPLVAAVGQAFVDESGAPVIPGTSVHRGRVALDREAFAHEYVKDAVSVEGAIASVARSVASTADAASDPRIGALAVRIQGELGFDSEYTLDQAQADERLDARRDAAERKSVALQSLLERLESESSWLWSQLR